MDVATRYKLLEKIGAGSFATVYRAQDQELGREVAVKQIHSQYLTETAQFERYWKEATLLASFQHPHIVTIYDVVRGQGWLILELMQANLRDRLQGRPMDIKAVQTTLTQSLRALSALHARGLVHGDIKPSNLMIDHRKRIKVGDFGLARRVSHDDGSVIRGTAKYMAPETLSQDFGEVGPQSDLYSLGFSAYELMCGSRFESLFPGLDAFGRDRQAAWMMWHAALDRKLADPARALQNVPPQLAQVIAGLIEKDPKKRYESADEALEDLGSAPGEPLAKTSEVSVGMKSPPEGKSSKRGLIIGLFCASMAASAAMLFWNPAPAPAPVPADRALTGIVRSIDEKTRTLELIDPLTGQPEELTLPDKTPIKLRAAGSEELVLLKRLQPGDWLRTSVDAGQMKLDVSRPVTHQGRIAAVDALASKVTIAIETQRLRDKVTLVVPASVKIQLNGKPAALKDLAPEDRVTVDHLLDPAGKEGELASRLNVFRTSTTNETIDSLDATKGVLRFSTSPADPAVLGPATAVQFEDGSPADLSELTPGRGVVVTRDAEVRRIMIPREVTGEVGMLSAIAPDSASITLQQAGGADAVIPLPLGGVKVLLNNTEATVGDLRPKNDRVTVLKASSGGTAVSSLRAERLPRFDRTVLTVASTTNRDRSIPVLEHVVADARSIGEMAVARYATPPEWAQMLVEPAREEVLAALKARLASLRANVQVIVAIEAQVFLADGEPVLAFADFRPNEAAKTGLKLADLLAELDAAAPTQKILLLDVMHPRPGFDDVAPKSPAELFQGLSRPKTVTVFASAAESDGAKSLFAATIARGLAGSADGDRDLTVTPEEWARFFGQELRGGVTQWP